MAMLRQQLRKPQPLEVVLQQKMFEQLQGNKGVVMFIVHLLAATIGTLLITAQLSFLLEQVISRDVVSLVAAGPSFLLPLMSGIALGYCFASIFPSRGATWVWAVPAFFLILNIAGSLSSQYERKDIWINEFGPQARCTACLDETFLTIPFFGCIGYGIGARVRPRKS
jgi:hypothetical protein